MCSMYFPSMPLEFVHVIHIIESDWHDLYINRFLYFNIWSIQTERIQLSIVGRLFSYTHTHKEISHMTNDYIYARLRWKIPRIFYTTVCYKTPYDLTKQKIMCHFSSEWYKCRRIYFVYYTSTYRRIKDSDEQKMNDFNYIMLRKEVMNNRGFGRHGEINNKISSIYYMP